MDEQTAIATLLKFVESLKVNRATNTSIGDSDIIIPAATPTRSEVVACFVKKNPLTSGYRDELELSLPPRLNVSRDAWRAATS